MSVDNSDSHLSAPDPQLVGRILLPVCFGEVSQLFEDHFELAFLFVRDKSSEHITPLSDVESGQDWDVVAFDWPIHLVELNILDFCHRQVDS